MTIKIGVFTTKRPHHVSVDVLRTIIHAFDESPKMLLAESDNYQGAGSERLQIWKQLFSKRVIPFNLSEDTETRQFQIGGENLQLSRVLFKPNVFVSTHVLRTFDRGSILKNLFGLVPDRKKSRFHKKLPTVLADLYEAIGGIDLAVMDGTNLWHAWTGPTTLMNAILLDRDAVAVETVEAILAGLNPEKMPVLQEFAKRGLGETKMENIEILGVSFDELKKECEAAIYASKKTKRAQSPQTWGGKANCALALLVEEGYFKPPKKRALEDILKGLERKGVSTKGKEEKVASSLMRRVNRYSSERNRRRQKKPLGRARKVKYADQNRLQEDWTHKRKATESSVLKSTSNESSFGLAESLRQQQPTCARYVPSLKGRTQ